MARAVVLLAPGFEEIEAVTPIDVLRRAGVDVQVLSEDGAAVEGAHGVTFAVDGALATAGEPDLLVLPGGMPGATNLAASAAIAELVRATHARGKLVGAICAAPAVALAPTGVLSGRRATCYPGFEERFPADVNAVAERVVVDGNLITSRGPGTALEFALTLVEQLVGAERAAQLRQGMLAQA